MKNSTKYALLFVPLLLLFAVSDLRAQKYMTETGTARFHSSVPMHSFTGTSEYLVGLINLETDVVDFYLDLATLKTGIEKRDRDMKETLEVEKYPFAEFYGKLASEFDPSSSEEQPVTVEGTFKIHGVEQQVTIEGTLQKSEEGVMVNASWVLELKDYKITPPQLLFFKVDQEQKIEIEALLKPVNE